MSHHNKVSLVGQLRADPTQVRVIQLTEGGMATPSIEFEVFTDLAEIGGRHHCLATGENALRVVAFSLAASGQPLEVDFWGWLRSQPDHVVIVTETIRFLVDSNTRERALKTLNEIRRGQVSLQPRTPADGEQGRALTARESQTGRSRLDAGRSPA